MCIFSQISFLLYLLYLLYLFIQLYNCTASVLSTENRVLAMCCRLLTILRLSRNQSLLAGSSILFVSYSCTVNPLYSSR